jgi:hypothetical protein
VCRCRRVFGCASHSVRYSLTHYPGCTRSRSMVSALIPQLRRQLPAPAPAPVGCNASLISFTINYLFLRSYFFTCMWWVWAVRPITLHTRGRKLQELFQGPNSLVVVLVLVVEWEMRVWCGAILTVVNSV